MTDSPFTLPSPRSVQADADFGFGCAGSRAAAAQRAGLGRGLAFVLVLAASSLASVYVPLVLHGPDWEEGTAPRALTVAR